MLQLILLCALLAFLELDVTYVGQVLISRPIVAGALLGMFSGDLFLGLQLGIFTELIYLDYIPVGGVVPPSGAISAGTAVLLAHFFAMDIYFAFFAGIITGIMFSFVEKGLRRYRTRILPVVEKALLEGKTSTGAVLAQSLVFQFLAVLIFLVVVCTLIGPLFAYFDEDIPQKMHIAFKFSYFVVPWIGLSVLFISFSSKLKED